MVRLLSLMAVLAMATVSFAEDSVVQKLQDVSVTIRAGNSQGSGILFTRKIDSETVTFVWTAGHVVDGLRKTRTVIDQKTGTSRIVVEFDDADIVKEFTENGRRVGEVKMAASVVKYSDSESGEDLALLMVRKKNYVPDSVSVKFYLDKDIPAIGTELYHVGSLRGQVGANSLTTGVVSQHGRVLNFGASDVIFDQTTVTAFPGSSGGGVYLKSDGRCVGMLVRGAGEQFNFIVPVRRLAAWAKKTHIEWAVDPSVPVPSLADIGKIKAEDSGVDFTEKGESKEVKADGKAVHLLIQRD